MLASTQGSLVMVGLNTEAPKVFWNGVEVPGISGIIVNKDAVTNKVVLEMQEDPTIVELRAAGVIVRREA